MGRPGRTGLHGERCAIMSNSVNSGSGCAAFWPLLAVAAAMPAGGGQARAQVQLYNADPLAEIRQEDDLKKSRPAQAVRLVGPRNGVCSAQVVALGEGADKLRATVGELKSAAGGTIPPDAVRIRYGGMRELKFKLDTGRFWGAGSDLYANSPYYDVLHDAPPAGAALVPIWVTVRVPADAQPGDYTGTLSVGEQELEVRLQVCRWRCPEPKDFVTRVGLIHSPETLAITYGVEMWSDRHWALMAGTFEFMGQLGNEDLFITALPWTHLGNAHAMVRFRKVEGGGYAPDLTVVDRYLTTYAEHAPRPGAIIVYLWDPVQKRVKGLRKSQKRWRGQKVTLLQPDGKLTVAEVPLPGEPGSAEMWKPVMDGIRARALELGWREDQIMVGCANDSRPEAATIGFFKEIAPYARWSLWTHGRGDGKPEGDSWTINGMEIGHYAHPYCADPVYPREDGILGGWDLEFQQTTNPRKFIFQYSPLEQFRNLAGGTTLTGGVRFRRQEHSGSGFTRLAMDFWEVPNKRSLLLRWGGGGNWDNFFRGAPSAVLDPGPDGPIGTVRFEMVREGIQECEARIRIEQALTTGKATGDLARRCRDLLVERIRVRYQEGRFVAGHGAQVQRIDGRVWGVAPDWQGLTARLFELAGEVAEATDEGK